MNSDKPASDTGSGETSRTSRPGSESEYLKREAQRAKEAMNQVLREMAETLKDSADPRAYVEQYPLISLAAAAGIGFVLASAVTPSREETLAERLKSLVPQRPVVPAEDYHPGPREQKKSWVGSIAGPLMGAVRDALVSSVTAAVSAKAQQGENPQPAHAEAIDPQI